MMHTLLLPNYTMPAEMGKIVPMSFDESIEDVHFYKLDNPFSSETTYEMIMRLTEHQILTYLSCNTKLRV